MEPEQALERLLIEEWSRGLRLTTIPQAMRRMGVDDRLPLRWRVARRMAPVWQQVLASPEKRDQVATALGRDLDEIQADRWRGQVATWNLASIVLADEEKLVARAILLRQRKEASLPRPGEIASALRLPLRTVHRALRELARLDFLRLDRPGRFSEYALADGHERFLEGLGFSFHTVTLDGGEQFGVP